MIEHRGTLISEDLFERRFVCDLNACKGACCVAGSSGAPLEVEEEALLQELWPKIRPYIPEKGQRAIDEHGVSELDEDGDILFGLADLGYPELGSFSLEELSSLRLPFGMGIERDILFTGDFPISIWAEAAREAGSIRAAERILYRAAHTAREGV